MNKPVIQLIAAITSHTHTNPDGSTIEIRALKEVYYINEEGDRFFMKKGKRVSLTEEEAHRLWDKTNKVK